MIFTNSYRIPRHLLEIKSIDAEAIGALDASRDLAAMIYKSYPPGLTNETPEHKQFETRLMVASRAEWGKFRTDLLAISNHSPEIRKLLYEFENPQQ